MTQARLLTLGFCFLLCQCTGYQLGGSKSTQLEHVRSLHVPTFTNGTAIPRAQVIATNSVIDQLLTEGTYHVSSAKQADAILRVKITGLSARPLRFARDDSLRAQEFFISMSLSYEVVDAATNEVLLSDQLTATTNTFVEENIQTSRYSGLPELSRQAAIELVNQITHGL